ncbi:MAG: type II secretion system F family protein [Candidatus Aenigmatarchaeota archaeon]
MERFIYRAKDTTGNLITGEMLSDSEDAVFRDLSSRELFVLNIERKKETFLQKISSYIQFLKKPIGFKRRVKTDDLLFFTYQLAAMVASGVSIYRALTAIEDEISKRSFKRIIGNIKNDIEAGDSFSIALSRYPMAFSRIYVNLIHAGETSGEMDRILNQIIIYLENISRIVAKIRGALAYPSLLIVFGIITVCILFLKVIPIFESVYRSFGARLPFLTEMLIGFSRFIISNLVILLVAFIILIFVSVMLLRSEKGRKLSDKIKFKIPLFGSLLHQFELARISRTLSTLIASGIPVTESITLTSDVVKSIMMRDALLRAKDLIEAGSTISHALKITGVFPSLFVQMVASGEETGKLPAMTEKVAVYYEESVIRRIDTISSIIEPLLIVAIGAVIGFIVVAMYLPIFYIGKIVR